MDAAELPPDELAALTESLTAALDTGAGRHTVAQFQVDMEGIPDPLAVMAWHGGRLRSAEPDPQAHGPFVGGEHMMVFVDLFDAAVRIGRPLHLIRYDFARDDGGWRYNLLLQSHAEYTTMRAERTEIDDAIAELMQAAAGTDWTFVLLSRDIPPPLRRLVCMRPDGTPQELPIGPALTEQLDALWRFHTERGFEPKSMAFTLGGEDLEQTDRQFHMFYESLREHRPTPAGAYADGAR